MKIQYLKQNKSRDIPTKVWASPLFGNRFRWKYLQRVFHKRCVYWKVFTLYHSALATLCLALYMYHIFIYTYAWVYCRPEISTGIENKQYNWVAFCCPWLTVWISCVFVLWNIKTIVFVVLFVVKGIKTKLKNFWQIRMNLNSWSLTEKKECDGEIYISVLDFWFKVL